MQFWRGVLDGCRPLQNSFSPPELLQNCTGGGCHVGVRRSSGEQFWRAVLTLGTQPYATFFQSPYAVEQNRDTCFVSCHCRVFVGILFFLGKMDLFYIANIDVSSIRVVLVEAAQHPDYSVSSLDVAGPSAGSRDPSSAFGWAWAGTTNSSVPPSPAPPLTDFPCLKCTKPLLAAAAGASASTGVSLLDEAEGQGNGEREN